MHFTKQQTAAVAVAVFSSRAAASGVGAIPLPKGHHKVNYGSALHHGAEGLGAINDITGIATNLQQRDPSFWDSVKKDFGKVEHVISEAAPVVEGVAKVASKFARDEPYGLSARDEELIRVMARDPSFWDSVKKDFGKVEHVVSEAAPVVEGVAKVASKFARDPKFKAPSGHQVVSAANGASEIASAADNVEQTVKGWWDQIHHKREAEAKFKAPSGHQVVSAANGASEIANDAANVEQTVKGWWDQIHHKREAEAKFKAPSGQQVVSAANGASEIASAADNVEQTVKGWWDQIHHKREAEAKFSLGGIAHLGEDAFEGVEHLLGHNQPQQTAAPSKRSPGAGGIIKLGEEGMHAFETLFQAHQNNQQNHKRDPKGAGGILHLGEEGLHAFETLFGHSAPAPAQASGTPSKRDPKGAGGLLHLGEDGLKAFETLFGHSAPAPAQSSAAPQKRDPKIKAPSFGQVVNGANTASSVVSGVDSAKDKVEGWYHEHFGRDFEAEY
jgi:hypothetical protein